MWKDPEFEESITIETYEETQLSEILQQIGAETGMSIFTPTGDHKIPPLSLNDVPLQQVLRELARLIDHEPEYEGRVVRFVKQGRGRKSYAVATQGYDEAEAIGFALRNSGLGDVSVVGSRLIISGTPDQVTRARELVDSMQAGRDAWIVELVTLRISDQLARRLGISAEATGRGLVSIGLEAGYPGSPAPRAQISLGTLLDVLGELSQRSSESVAITRSIVHVLEGGSASVRQGDTVPVPQRTISDQGTVTVTGFTMIETGYLLDVQLSRVDGDRVACNIRPEISGVVGFVEDAPIVTQSSATATVILEPGEWSIVSGLRDVRKTRVQQGMPGTEYPLGQSRSTTETEDQVYILVRGVRVDQSLR